MVREADRGLTGVSVLQQAALLRARVIGTASPGRFGVVRRFGAEPVAHGPGLAGRVAALAGDGLDASLDCVGTEEATEVALAMVGDRSRIMTIAAGHLAAAHGFVGVSGGEPGSMAYRLAQRQRTVDLAAAGALAVPVARTCPLSDAAQAPASARGRPGGEPALVP